MLLIIMEVLLDSNFIISCVKRKIDFVSELELLGLKTLLPREVVQELKDLRLNSKHDDIVAINVALEMFGNTKLKKIKLGTGKVDEKLIDMGKKGAYIASLDAYIKRSVPNRVVISNSANKLIIERS